MQKSALLIASILFVAHGHASADNHGPYSDLPYCGDLDGILANAHEPECIAWDGDIPAQPDLEPTHFIEGHKMPMNTIAVTEPLSGRAMSIIADQRFGSRDAVAIIIAHTPEEIDEPETTCDTLFCAGPHTRWTAPWWHQRNAHHKGDDERETYDYADAQTSTPQPDRGWTETPRDPNPWRDGNHDRDQPAERDYKGKHGLR